MNIRLRIVQKCAFENARSESLYHLKDAVRLWNSIGMDFSVSLGDLIDGQNMGSHRLGNAGSWAMRFNSRCPLAARPQPKKLHLNTCLRPHLA